MTETKYIRSCSIWRSLEVLGDKPTLLLIESYWMGARRFSEFQAQTGLLKTVISDRLQKLIKAGCLVKVPYSDRPRRYEYKGTAKFLDLYQTALSMLYWERKWNARSSGIDLKLVHKTCGRLTEPKPVCPGGFEDIDPRQVDWREGPGVGMMPATYSRRRRQSAAAADTSTPLFDEIAEIIGDRWSALIIRSIFTGINRFQDIQEDSGAATNILSDRLGELAARGILKKTRSSQKHGRRHYQFTEKGRDIYPIIIALRDWGDKYYPAPDGPPLLLNHRDCGQDLYVEIACPECGEAIRVGDIEIDKSFGASARSVKPLAS